MKVTSILGIDISKSTIDCHLHLENNSLAKIGNNIKGFNVLKKWLLKETKLINEVLVVMEFTGLYTYNLERYLFKQNIAFVKRPALDIKRSLGMVRGKTDLVDAKFISKYGWMRKDELQPMKPLNDTDFELQFLMSHRDKLVADKASYMSKYNESKSQLGEKINSKVESSTQFIIDIFSLEIKNIEQEIKQHIKSDISLEKNYKLITSVVGIGFNTAVHLLISTGNFTKFENVRKLMCYCGVAPFEHSSGTSVRGKTKVSHLANKKLKSLLTMGANSAIQHDPELKRKYEQKVKQGKPKMSAINIIRAKLLERVFSVVKKQTPYIVNRAA